MNALNKDSSADNSPVHKRGGTIIAILVAIVVVAVIAVILYEYYVLHYPFINYSIPPQVMDLYEPG